MLNVIEVRNLPRSMARPYIKIIYINEAGAKIEIGSTQSQTWENAVFNQRFQFKVNSERDYVLV